ncbi:MAG: yidC [Bacteroidetes bacterium]|nr:yidC [Bacteroidota bacterium]
MDRQSTIGFVLITIVLIVWMWVQAPPPAEQQPVRQDSTAAQAAPAPSAVPPPPAYGERTQQDSLGRFFAARQRGNERVIVVETDLYRAELTTLGGTLRIWELRAFRTWDGHPVQLVDYDAGRDLSVLFTSTDGKLVNTSRLYFDADQPSGVVVTLSGTDSRTVTMTLPVQGGGALLKRYTFTNGTYLVDTEVEFRGLAGVVSNFEYQIVWEHGVRYAEGNSVDESTFAMAYASSGGELTELDVSGIGETGNQDLNGKTAWVATRNKYFGVALIAPGEVAQGAYLEGDHRGEADGGSVERYAVALKMPFRGQAVETGKVSVYLGPLEYDGVKGLGVGLEQVMNLGAAWIIRPISEYLMIPLFTVLKAVIPNYGWVIVVFSLIIKVVLHPLTKSSMNSMRRMQALSPMMNEIREKHKDNPEKMNQAVMNLYKEYGVNPASGCLPLLLQMPIMFALYSVLRSSIELRQASFFGWITDLSIPDALLKLPFTIPIFGIHEVSGLALIMGITMFIQQKMTVTDPRQKSMVYVMPVMFTLLFNNFPSGLNLYYLVFNVLSIGQQMWTNKVHGNEPLRKVEPKKQGGLMSRIAKDLPKLK